MLSKYAYFIPRAHLCTVVGVANLFFENVFKLHALPKSIVCDRDLMFTSAFWREFFWLNRTFFSILAPVIILNFRIILKVLHKFKA